MAPAADMFMTSLLLLRPTTRPSTSEPIPQSTPAPTNDHATALRAVLEPPSPVAGGGSVPGVVPPVSPGAGAGGTGAGGPTGLGAAVTSGGVAAAWAFRFSSTLFSRSAILRSTSSRLRALGARWRYRR